MYFSYKPTLIRNELNYISFFNDYYATFEKFYLKYTDDKLNNNLSLIQKIYENRDNIYSKFTQLQFSDHFHSENFIFDFDFNNPNNNLDSKEGYESIEYGAKPNTFKFRYPTNITEKLDTSKRNKTILFINVDIIYKQDSEYDQSGHANALLFNFKDNKLELFEPSGKIDISGPINVFFMIYFKQLFPILQEIIYVRHNSDICQTTEDMTLQTTENMCIGEKWEKGYCMTWVVLMQYITIKNKYNIKECTTHIQNLVMKKNTDKQKYNCELKNLMRIFNLYMYEYPVAYTRYVLETKDEKQLKLIYDIFKEDTIINRLVFDIAISDNNLELLEILLDKIGYTPNNSYVKTVLETWSKTIPSANKEKNFDILKLVVKAVKYDIPYDAVVTAATTRNNEALTYLINIIIDENTDSIWSSNMWKKIYKSIYWIDNEEIVTKLIKERQELLTIYLLNYALYNYTSLNITKYIIDQYITIHPNMNEYSLKISKAVFWNLVNNQYWSIILQLMKAKLIPNTFITLKDNFDRVALDVLKARLQENEQFIKKVYNKLAVKTDNPTIEIMMTELSKNDVNYSVKAYKLINEIIKIATPQESLSGGSNIKYLRKYEKYKYKYNMLVKSLKYI
jgi:hypothetical protein